MQVLQGQVLGVLLQLLDREDLLADDPLSRGVEARVPCLRALEKWRIPPPE
jgi:hypothetical protein